MQLEQINQHLRSASLPEVTAGQLDELRSAGELPLFECMVVDVAGGIAQSRPELELLLRCVSANTAATLTVLGIEAPMQAIIAAAKRERMNLFRALHTIRLDGERKVDAIAYIKSIKFAAPALPTQGIGTPGRAPAPYYSFKLFGQVAALCVAEAKTKGTDQHTIQVEAAGALGNGSRQFDWTNKIIVQLTIPECYQLAALCEGHLNQVAFKGHGVKHDKALYVQRQPGRVFFKMVQEGRGPLLVPVQAIEAMPLVNLLYRQILQNETHLTIDELKGNLNSMARLLAT